MLDLVLILLATFWAWETLRYAVESVAPRVVAATRPLHGVIAAALPLYVLWPNWVAALAVAGATGLLVAWTDRAFGNSAPTPISIPRRDRGGLPPLP